MKRLLVLSVVLVLSLVMATAAVAQDSARVRVVHASPDAPAVDVWVNGAVAFSNAPFEGITDYAELAAGTYNVQVSPTGATEPIVIDADLDLAAGTDYTVVAVGLLENIEPLVLVDNNNAPAAGKAHVRFVHASPDAPAVDIAVANGGPVLFANVAFKGVGDYLPVDAGTYDLEVRLAGTDTVALSVPGVSLADSTVYTVFAMGLAGGEPALKAVPSVDASYEVPTTLPETLPETGGEMTSLWLIAAIGAGLALIGGGLFLRQRASQDIVNK
jgi:LPXTG-motif cell wall-anchored protein